MATSMAVGVLCAKPRVCTSYRRQRSSSVVCAIRHTQNSASQAPSEPTRRGVLLASLLGTAALTVGPAQAGLVQDLMKQNMRGDLDPIEAIVQLMDARGVLYEIRDLAATPKDSPERRASYSLLPGYASRLRKLANAAPTVAGLAAGTDKEAQVSVAYGGNGQDTSLTDPVFITSGQVLNYSGRGLSEVALADPACAAAAISAIEDLLGKVPQNALATAQARREAARAARRT